MLGMWQNPKEQPEKKSKEKETREIAHVHSCWVNMTALTSLRQPQSKGQREAQQVEGLATSPTSLTPIPTAHLLTGENWPLTSTHCGACMHVCTGVNVHTNKQTNKWRGKRLGETCHSLGWWHSPLIPPFMGDQQSEAILRSAVTTRPGWVTWNPALKQHFKKKIYHKGDH